MERQPLTSRQQEILDYMEGFTLESGYPPTVREICKATGLKSPRSVSQHLQALERKGYIARGRDKSRAIRFLHKDISGTTSNAVSLPQLSDGRPTDVSFAVDRQIGSAEGSFVTLADVAMEQANILVGDWLVVAPGASTSDGDIVVAATPGEVGVRKFERVNGSGRLVASGKNPVSAAASDVEIVGKVVGVVRKLS